MPVRDFVNKVDWDAFYQIDVEPEGHPNTRPGIRLGFNRASILPLYKQWLNELIRIKGWNAQNKPEAVLIIGPAMWAIEDAQERFPGVDIYGVSPSALFGAWVHTAKNTSEESEIDAAITLVGLDPANGDGATKKQRLFRAGNRTTAGNNILDEMLDTAASRTRVRNAMNNNPFYAITWGILPFLTNAESRALSNRLHQTAGLQQLIHLTLCDETYVPQEGDDPNYQPEKLGNGLNGKTLAEWAQHFRDTGNAAGDLVIDLTSFDSETV